MRVFLDTVGCRLNQAEIETIARMFRVAGHEIVGEARNADLAVVNTCSVTAQAASDSRGALRRIGRAGNVETIATGCWATLEPAAAGRIPGVSRVIPNPSKDQLVELVLGPPAVGARSAEMRIPLPGGRHRTRAFIKVQDGCDNRCTFCATTLARGTSRSRDAAEVIREIRMALRGGYKEIVLTGVHLGAWGQETGSNLKDLIRAILSESDAGRVRLSSLEPWDLSADFFELWRDPRLCPHFHLPLQSGCASTLRRMARKTTPEAFRALVIDARSIVPDAAITTDVISGFPGETQAEFDQSLTFVRDLALAGGHAFAFSPMVGTAAARMPSQVAAAERRRRNSLFRQAFEESARAFRGAHLSTKREVLWETSEPLRDGTWELSGFTDNYLRVRAPAPKDRWNETDWVTLVRATGDEILGNIHKSG